jgi:hypothetical protein
MDPSSDAVKAMRHSEAITSQKEALCGAESGVVWCPLGTPSDEDFDDGIETVQNDGAGLPRSLIKG